MTYCMGVMTSVGQMTLEAGVSGNRARQGDGGCSDISTKGLGVVMQAGCV